MEGRQHDITLYRQNWLDESLDQNVLKGGEQYCAYADSEYMLQPWVLAGFTGQLPTTSEQAHKVAMSTVRVRVERSYEDIKQ